MGGPQAPGGRATELADDGDGNRERRQPASLDEVAVCCEQRLG